MTVSRLYLDEEVPNADRKFGSDNLYAPAYVMVNSKWEPALFTATQLKTAIDRARKNPEDVRPMAGYFARLWSALLGR